MATSQLEFENGNGHRGPAAVDFDLGRKGGYSADIFHGASYYQRKGTLAKIAIDLVIEAGLFSPDVARDIVTRGMESHAGQNTSMILFRRKADINNPHYVGFSWQEVFHIPTNEGDIPLTYLRLRAFEKRHRRQHLGRAAVQLTKIMYKEAKYFAHRTQSPAAALSVMESGIFIPGRLLPWEGGDEGYDEIPEMEQLKDEVFARVKINGQTINKYGVSEGDYPEFNEAFEVDVNHPQTMALRRRMTEKYGMVFSRGDSLTIVGQLI